MAETATQSTPAGNTNGATAPNESVTAAEDLIPQSRVQSIAAKEKREGARVALAKLFEELGVTDQNELSALLQSGRAAKPKEQSETERVTEKLKAEASKREAALTAELERMRAVAEQATIRDAVRASLAGANLTDGAEDMILATLGVAPPQHRVVLKDGKPVVVDGEGDAVDGGDVAKYVKKLLHERQYLVRGTATATVPTRNGSNGSHAGDIKKELAEKGTTAFLRERFEQAMKGK